MGCLEKGGTEKNLAKTRFILFKSHLATFIAMPSNPSLPMSYDCSLCNRHFTSSGGLARHKKANHPMSSSPPEESTKYVRVRHNYLTGQITFLSTHQHELTSNL